MELRGKVASITASWALLVPAPYAFFTTVPRSSITGHRLTNGRVSSDAPYSTTSIPRM